MEKKVLLFLLSMLLINFVSAAYTCSGTASTEEGFINIGQIEPINKVSIALIDSSTGKAAEMLIDAKELTLTSESNYTNVTLVNGHHDINLTRVTSSFALIKIDNDIEGRLEEKVVAAVDDLQVYTSKLEGTYPEGSANVQFFIGSGYLFLYSSNPEEVKTIGGVEYLFELSSSDSSGAIIDVTKCGGGSFAEVAEPAEQEPDDSENPPPENESLNNNGTGDSENDGVEEKTFLQNTLYIVVIILIIIVILVVFAVLVIKYKAYKEAKE